MFSNTTTIRVTLLLFLMTAGFWLTEAAEPRPEGKSPWRQPGKPMLVGQLKSWDGVLSLSGANREALRLEMNGEGRCRIIIEKGELLGWQPLQKSGKLPEDARRRLLESWAGAIERFSFENLDAPRKKEGVPKAKLTMQTKFCSITVEELALDKNPLFQADLKELVSVALREIEMAGVPAP